MAALAHLHHLGAVQVVQGKIVEAVKLIGMDESLWQEVFVFVRGQEGLAGDDKVASAALLQKKHLTPYRLLLPPLSQFLETDHSQEGLGRVVHLPPRRTSWAPPPQPPRHAFSTEVG